MLCAVHEAHTGEHLIVVDTIDGPQRITSYLKDKWHTYVIVNLPDFDARWLVFTKWGIAGD